MIGFPRRAGAVVWVCCWAGGEQAPHEQPAHRCKISSRCSSLDVYIFLLLFLKANKRSPWEAPDAYARPGCGEKCSREGFSDSSSGLVTTWWRYCPPPWPVPYLILSLGLRCFSVVFSLSQTLWDRHCRAQYGGRRGSALVRMEQQGPHRFFLLFPGNPSLEASCFMLQRGRVDSHDLAFPPVWWLGHKPHMERTVQINKKGLCCSC